MQAQIDKSKVALSFSRAAESYDSAAGLQRDVGERLMTYLTLSGAKAQKVLDLGSGTGFFSEQLAQVFGNQALTCLDIAQGMLTYARRSRQLAGSQWICADAEALPCRADSFDLIYSSLAIQWCENLPALFSELSRVLEVGGCAFLSTLGPNSLYELRKAWSGVDQKVHVNNFVDLQQLQLAIPAAFSIEVLDTEMKVLEYEYLRGLTDDLKKIGAHNMNAGEAKGLTGRAKIKKFKKNYELFRQDNGALPASYEVVYIVLKRVV